MAPKRSVDIITEAFSDVMTARRKYELKNPNGEILKEIFEHQARLDLTCRFSWTEDTVAIWDNRSVIHYAIADFFPGRGLGYERIMDRIAIEGDHPQ